MKHSILIIGLFTMLSCANSEECPVGTFNCLGICADLLSDPSNCGACGLTCAQGHVCQTGVCVLSCQEGHIDCSGTCRDVMTDQYNCGTCGMTCAAGYTCIDGACAPDCPEGYTACSGVCKNLTNDPANCGECANACAAGEVCMTGACSFTCPSPYIDCSGSCADLDADHLNCGSCGNACLSGQICEAGACANSCIAGLTLCSGACADLQRDPENCGSCASRCGTGENCYAGACIAACPGGFTDCSGTCRDLDSDRLNCGACETECEDGEVCSSGACTVSCASPLISCPVDSDGDTVADGEVCTDTTTDPDNCGGCAGSGGIDCGYDEACVAGVCRTHAGTGFMLCLGRTWCAQAGTSIQYTTCESAADGGATCINPEVRYGSTVGGIPATHSGNRYDTWCTQLGFSSGGTVTLGPRTCISPQGKLFGCTSYDETGVWHWCDWRDGRWRDTTLDYHTCSSDMITSLTCTF